MDRTKRYSRLAGGISIGSEEVTAGTLSGWFTDLKDREQVLVSCWHVFKGKPGETRILQPGRYDGGRIPNDIVGTLKRYVPLDRYGKLPWWKRIICMLFGWFLEEWCLAGKEPNLVDVACARFEPWGEDRILVKGVYLDDGSIIWPRGTHDGDNIVGRRVWKSGRSTGVTFGTVIDDSATVKVWYGDRYILFQDQIIVEGRCEPGDSGSPVFLMSGDRISENDMLVGLLFAGNPRIYVACKYKHIRELLGVSWY